MLRIRDLSVHIGDRELVSIAALDIPEGGRLGLVGESGSGKTLTAMSVPGLLPRTARVSGSIELAERDLLRLPERRLAAVRGAEIGVVFQDPLRALNPMMRIGRQVAEAVRLHDRMSRRARRARVVELLEQVRLPEPESLLRAYPHQLSGGQRQRVLIAMAIANRPRLLIADEPTTALDVTVQKGILDLLLQLSRDSGMSMLFVSHDLGVVRTVSDHMAVMYAGRIVETGPTAAVIERPRHRYTQALIEASPSQAATEDVTALLGRPLHAIPGSVPAAGRWPEGCRFRGRCEHEVDRCRTEPAVTSAAPRHEFMCWNPTSPVGADLDQARR